MSFFYHILFMVASLGLASEVSAQDFPFKNITYKITTAYAGGNNCTYISTLRFAKGSIFMPNSEIDCGNGFGETAKGYGVIYPINGSAKVVNSCSVEFGGRVERCTDGYTRQRDGSMKTRETWTGSRSSKVSDKQIQINQRVNYKGGYSDTSGGSGSYNTTVTVKLVIKLDGRSCKVTTFQQRGTGKSGYSIRLLSSDSCKVS